MPLSYLTGDATKPIGPGQKLLIHVVNNADGWGRGFVTALSARWSAPEHAYRRWARGPREKFVLGMIQPVRVADDLTVINMLAQDGYRSTTKRTPLDYDALDICLAKVAALAIASSASVHAPRIGAGLAGGDWARIEQMLDVQLVKKGITVTIYNLPTTPN